MRLKYIAYFCWVVALEALGQREFDVPEPLKQKTVAAELSDRPTHNSDDDTRGPKKSDIQPKN